MKQSRLRATAALTAGAAVAEATLVHLGRTYGSTAAERTMGIAGDDIVANPAVVTNHAITIDAPPEDVWPWLVQMGWGRGGWYTARWVDRLLFPANRASANEIAPELQNLKVGDFIPDGAPETKTGFIVEQLVPNRALVLHSTSHLPASWRDNQRARMDWSWVFNLTPIDGGRRTRYLFRSRWTTSPWWFTLAGWLGIVPADFVMSRDHLHGVKVRAEALAHSRPLGRTVRPDPRAPDAAYAPSMTDDAPDPHPEPFVVATYPDRGEAEVTKAHLASSGIEAFIVDEVEGGMLPVDGETGVTVLVHAQDAEAARQVIAPGDPS